jgi:molybdopterin-guanine dinucleotide biosynthesis protein A
MSLPRPFDSDLKVLVLAGGEAHRSVRGGVLAGKAFLKLRGRLVIEYVLDVLRECGLGRPWVVAEEQHLALIPARHAFIPVAQPAGGGFFDNLLAGHEAVSPAAGEPLLIVFGDHPLNSRVALELFLGRCADGLDQADFFHALALEDPYREYWPWFRRTSVHMREMSGRASGLTLVVPARLHGVAKLQALYEVRKLERPGAFLHLLVHLMRWLGRDAPGSVSASLLMYLAKEFEKAGRVAWPGAGIARRLEARLAAALPVARMQRYAARVLGAERGVRFIPIAHGGLAIDVDYADELAVLEKQWDAIAAIAARQDEQLRARSLRLTSGPARMVAQRV